MMMPQATQQAYDQHMMAHMAAQMAGPSAIQPVTAQPGSAPVAGAMLGGSGVARPGAPGVQPPIAQTDPLAPLPAGFVAGLGAVAQRAGSPLRSVTGAAASAAVSAVGGTLGAANRAVSVVSGPL